MLSSYCIPVGALAGEPYGSITKMHSLSDFGLSFDRSPVRTGSLMGSLIVGSCHSSADGQFPNSIS